MTAFNRTAAAVWTGSGKEGKGTLSTESGALSTTPFSFARRFGEESGTNPEELVAAAHAACFTMALAVALGKAGITPQVLETEAKVTIRSAGQGFEISTSALSLKAKIDGIPRDQFEKIALETKAGCPVSKLLKAEITLDWTLDA